MHEQEIKLINSISALVSKLFRGAGKLKFAQVSELAREIRQEMKRGNALPAANMDPSEFDDYPPPRESAYLGVEQPPDLVAKIVKAAPRYACKCPSEPCECSPTEECHIQTNGFLCHFCEQSLPRFSDNYTLSNDAGENGYVCRRCRRILLDHLYPKWSISEDITVLVEDAYEEIRYFQFAKGIKFMDQAVKLADEAARRHEVLARK